MSNLNLGEEICGEWLRHLKGCDFVQFNVRTLDCQGEIDVIGINLDKKIVYACESAVHLTTGLQYTKEGSQNNEAKLTEKFRRGARYLAQKFPGYIHILMFWSPIVKNQKVGSKSNQVESVKAMAATLLQETGLVVELVINDQYREALANMRDHAADVSPEMLSPVMRLFQIEESLKHHLRKP